MTSIALNFIYASEEFPEYAATEYADGFAFVVDGVNYEAKFADGSTVSLLTLGSNANLFNNASSVYRNRIRRSHALANGDRAA